MGQRERQLRHDGSVQLRVGARHPVAGRRSLRETITRVVHGVVTVRDFVRHRTVLVHAGHTYIARAPKRH